MSDTLYPLTLFRFQVDFERVAALVLARFG